MKNLSKALTFDDILLVPDASDILPKEIDISTKITNDINLSIPFLSSAMDTVTEYKMAIAMAEAGGIGVIHKNMSIEAQIDQAKKVKKYEAGMVTDPITLFKDDKISVAINYINQYGISGFPVVDKTDKTLIGILTNRDIRFVKNPDDYHVQDFMTTNRLITLHKNEVSRETIEQLLHQNRIEKLLVVDDNFHCSGLITAKDIERASQFPNACKDEHGRLRVACAIGTDDDSFERATELVNIGVDLLVIDTAHGHSKNVIKMVERVASQKMNTKIVAGNIATYDAAQALVEAGADAVKVGIGPGSICTTRIIAGIGVPQFTAIYNVSQYCKPNNIPVIADGGIRTSGDVAKAIAAGADVVMIGSLFAGTDEAPGDVFLYEGRAYKSYRGMGSLAAMKKGSADRYFQDSATVEKKLVPEGIEGRVPYKGSINNIIDQLTGGLKSSMGYTGHKTIGSLKNHENFVEISNAGYRESHVHDVAIVKEAPNYQVGTIK